VLLEHASGRLRYELIELKKSLLAGASFSQALAKSGIFPATMVQLVMAGEASGELAPLLTQIHQQQIHQQQIHQLNLK